jgi:hypothetical protein
MKNFIMSAMALAAVLVVPNVASADDLAAERSQAIALCRAEVQAQAGAEATVRLDQVRVRARTFRVDLDLWRGSNLQNVRCDVERGQELTIASITPTVQTAQLAR